MGRQKEKNPASYHDRQGLKDPNQRGKQESAALLRP